MNPQAPTHWSKTRLVDRIESGELRGKVINSRLADNHFIDAQVRQELAADFHGHFHERFIEGQVDKPRLDWSTRTIRPATGSRRHCGIMTSPSTGARRIRPAALLLGCDAQGRWHTCREYHHDGRRDGARSAADHADAIVALLDGRPLATRDNRPVCPGIKRRAAQAWRAGEKGARRSNARNTGAAGRVRGAIPDNLPVTNCP